MTRSAYRVAVNLPQAEPELDGLLRTGPFHVALRVAIRERGLTLERLRARLGQRGIQIGLSSLSDWQLGYSQPERTNSLRAVSALEEILGLRPGALVALLTLSGDRRVRRRAEPLAASGSHRRDPRTAAVGAAVAALLADLPAGYGRDFEVLSQQQTLEVDAQRRPTLIRSRTLVRALRDGVDRYVLWYFGDPGCVIERVRPEALENCRVGAVRRHRGGQVMVAEILFDEVLRAGDTWVFERQVVDGTGGIAHEWAHAFPYPVDQQLLEVKFSPQALPAACYAYTQSGLLDERQRMAALTLRSGHNVHLAVSGVAAGVFGIGWEWDETSPAPARVPAALSRG